MRNGWLAWWHRGVLRHEVTVRRVSVPMWDMSAYGELIDCSCGKGWSR